MAHVTAAERRPQLIKAAIELMGREGVAAGSTRAIAAELGVAQATVHYTFGTKEELYRAVLEQLTQDLIAQVEQAVPEDAGFEETLRTLVGVLWQTVRERPDTYQLINELNMFALRVPHMAEAIANHYRKVVAATARLAGDAAERAGRRLAVPADVFARFFLAGFDGLTLQHLSYPDEEAETACLEALLSSVLALADGGLSPVPAQAD